MAERFFEAAVLHRVGQPLSLETVVVNDPLGSNVLVRIKAAGLCHTDLEAADGSLRIPLPVILGHEAAGIVEAIGPDVRNLEPGDHVILSWNPNCGSCYYCDRDAPILCEQYLRGMSTGSQLDGGFPVRLAGGERAQQLMFIGAFAEFCVVSASQAVRISPAMPLDRACLIGCAGMTGFGGATKVADISDGDAVTVIGCGAVGLAAIQGARSAGAASVIAVDLDNEKLSLATQLGANIAINGRQSDLVETIRAATSGRGADVTIEAAGAPAAFRVSVEATRPGGQIIWLGKVDVEQEVSFRWGSLMQERRIRRNSYGDARPSVDFPAMAQAYLAGTLRLGELITHRIGLRDINSGLDRLRRGETIRTVVIF